MTQMVVGLILAQSVLWAFGLPFDHSLAIGATMFVVSYVRSYAIRRAFAAIGRAR